MCMCASFSAFCLSVSVNVCASFECECVCVRYSVFCLSVSVNVYACVCVS